MTSRWAAIGAVVLAGVGCAAQCARAQEKPANIRAGGDRPADWGIEIGFKVLGF